MPCLYIYEMLSSSYIDAVFLHALLGILMHALDGASVLLFNVIFTHAIICTSMDILHAILWQIPRKPHRCTTGSPMPISLHMLHGIFMYILDNLFMHIEWCVNA